MKLHYHPRIIEQLAEAPSSVRKSFDKQVRLLTDNFRHPSLRAKKYNEASNIWQARINRDWRFYFLVRSNTYYILDIKRHPK